MNYIDYRAHLKVCEFLGKEPAGKYKKVHDFLTGMWDGVECVVDSRLYQIISQNTDGWILEQGNLYMWCQNERVWSFFREDMDMELTTTQDFVKNVVADHLQCTMVSPARGQRRYHYKVEEHLRCTVGTPEKQTCQV